MVDDGVVGDGYLEMAISNNLIFKNVRIMLFCAIFSVLSHKIPVNI